MGACSPRGALPNSRTNLWVAVHRQSLGGATGISLDLDISATFTDIIAIDPPIESVASTSNLEVSPQE